ncbi:NAD(P)H-hydrate dehydratase [Roseovarius pacificus]|uniref:NAD(P)H-hydrate dehydratase n=1 Tax=Roseovarius pacificus TaxID=337701 RepID=UPI002A18B873|nr:NAD(P)H-hydrate dehydratase [Roseovarius pacificus]
MTELLTAAQMRAIERAAIESGEVTGLELMERAGRGVVEVVFEEWPELAKAPHRAVVLCGPGNNGGDGFVVARLLKDWGWEVEVFLYGDPAKLPADARANYERWGEMGEVQAWDESRVTGQDADLFVDAVFGAGLTRAIPDEVGEALAALYMRGASFGRLVSVDAPSGLCMDSGRPLGDVHGAVWSWLNVSFHRARIGQYLDEGPLFCTRNVVKDIGLGMDETELAVTLLDERYAQDVGSLLLTKVGPAHKYTHGHALILSGGAGRTGAARLAARGALRVGAGLVTLGVPGSAQMEVACQITALMLRRVEDGEALAEALEDERLNALCLGPGMGMERARNLVPVAVRAQRAPYVVLDADALTAFADDPEALFALLHDKCVLTPHGGEFARLFPDIAEKLHAPAVKGPAYSKVDATREAAKRAGCVVLFKGPDTVIAAPDGRCSINSARYERAAPWLATAGAGDVLAGFITGLLARGVGPMQAAETAAWLHVEAARAFGSGLIAEDLPEMLPTVLRDLGL